MPSYFTPIPSLFIPTPFHFRSYFIPIHSCDRCREESGVDRHLVGWVVRMRLMLRSYAAVASRQIYRVGFGKLNPLQLVQKGWVLQNSNIMTPPVYPGHRGVANKSPVSETLGVATHGESFFLYRRFFRFQAIANDFKVTIYD